MSAVQLGLVILLTTAFMVNEYYLFSGVVVVLYITYTLIRGLYKRIVFYILCICLILFRYQQFRMFDEPTYKEIGFVYQIQNSGYVIKNIKSKKNIPLFALLLCFFIAFIVRNLNPGIILINSCESLCKLPLLSFVSGFVVFLKSPETGSYFSIF